MRGIYRLERAGLLCVCVCVGVGVWVCGCVCGVGGGMSWGPWSPKLRVSAQAAKTVLGLQTNLICGEERTAPPPSFKKN
jgi:hypothetical protein